MNGILKAGVVLGLALTAATRPASAQDAVSWDPLGPEMSRAELDSLLARLTRAGESSAYSSSLRQRSSSEAAVVRDRLVSGDFQVGDRILLRVENEPALTDTFLVAAGPAVLLPVAGDISLRGVLRSELSKYLTAEIGKYVREPIVHVRSLVQLSVTGGVVRPGFHTVPADSRLSDVLMVAGLTPQGNLREFRVERGTERLWDGEALQTATNQGRTVDQLNLRAGDQIVIPTRGNRNFENIFRTLSIALAIPASIFGLIQIF